MTERSLLHPHPPRKHVVETSPTDKIWRGFSRFLTYALLIGWSLFIIYGITWIIFASVKSNREIFTNQFLPTELHFENYVKVFTTLNFGRYLFNSILYVGLSLVILLAVCAPAAYVLSRFEFPGKKLITTLFAAGMGVPAPLLFIPMFVLFVRLSLNNTIPGIIIAYVSVSVPFTVYVLTGFFASLPKELEEAAMIDGCTSLQVFWHVMLPLAQPGLLTAAIFNGVSMWKEFQWALIFVNTKELRTLSLGLYSLKTAMQYSADWAGLYAAVVVVMVPTIILYIFLSEQMIAGITMGSVKS